MTERRTQSDLGILPGSESPTEAHSPSESASRILADDGTWTKGDARICAEFVLAAQADFKARVSSAREALDADDEAVVKYLRGDDA